jgi:hypothetical protein
MDRLMMLAKRWTIDLLPEIDGRYALRPVELAFWRQVWNRQSIRPELLRQLALLALIVVVPGGSLVALSLCALQRGRRAIAAAREPT